MKFNIVKKAGQSGARAGEFQTGHGKVKTPVFMPVGTVGTIKGINTRELEKEVRSQMLLSNTYHLFLRPGTQVLEDSGGLHRFINWDKPILTDSGGYQVFSLSSNRKLTREGAFFQSHIDGSRHMFTPENVVDIQRSMGSDIMMAFDECTPYPCDHTYARESMELTHHWLTRGIERYRQTNPRYGHDQFFFPIVQGSVYTDLRKESARFIRETDQAGYAIGGLSVGEPEHLMYEMVEVVNEILPQQRPRYLMGVGTPVNILEAIDRGVDMFDCVIPTRNGRNGMLFTRNGIINIKNQKWRNDFSPLDEDGESYVDHHFSKAYLRHLINAREITAGQIATLHNLSFYMWLVKEARQQIQYDTFSTWKKEMVEILNTRL
ncbi:MAG TPA: tRNA guanosine(34) transglycosylase Tgt [Bacteroidales bacterium]|nr:tRNA guanosine(34) transglycosylase Tgt [Bacteroidales bacterium]